MHKSLYEELMCRNLMKGFAERHHKFYHNEFHGLSFLICTSIIHILQLQN